MKNFKFIFIICIFLSLLTGCTNNQVKEENRDEKTIAITLGNQFESEIKAEKDIEKVAKKIAANKAIKISVDVSQIKKGDYISGFQKEIKGFKKAYVIRPVVGTIPFVAYIFEVENANAFASELKESADLRWNICTEADEAHAVVSGDYVFFIMAPKNFEQEE